MGGAATSPVPLPIPQGLSPPPSVVPVEACGWETEDLGSSPALSLSGCVALGSLFTSLSLPPLTRRVSLCPCSCWGLLGRFHETVSVTWSVVDMSCCVARPLSGNSWQISRPPAPCSPAITFRHCFSGCLGCQPPTFMRSPDLAPSQTS